MSDENKVQIEFEAELSEFEKQVNDGLKKIKQKVEKQNGPKTQDIVELPQAEEVNGLYDKFVKVRGMATDVAASVYLVQAAFEGTLWAANKFLDTLFEGEKLIKIDKQFNNMANSFGIAGDKLRDSFLDATGGIVDDDDAIQSLTEKIVVFGKGVNDLPKLFDTARRAANLFGGDAQAMFDQLAFAAQTGNTRSIRFLFPKLDLQKAVEEYAISQGKLVSELKEEEVIQARLAKLQEEASRKLKDVSAEAGTATEAWAKLKVSFDNYMESVSIQSAKNFGPAMKAIFEWTGEVIKKASELDTFQNSLDNSSEKIYKLMDAKKAASEGAYVSNARDFENEKFQVSGLNFELKDLIKSKEDAQNITGMFKTSESPAQEAPSNKFAEARLSIERSYNEKLLQSRIDLNGKLMAAETDSESKLTMLRQNNALLTQQENQKFLDAKMALIDQYRSKELLTEAQAEQAKRDLKNGKVQEDAIYYQSLQLMAQEHANKLLMIKQNTLNQEKELESKAMQEKAANQMSFQDGILSAAEGFGSMLVASAKDLQKNYTQTMKQIASTAINGLGNGVAQGVKKMTMAFREGKNGLQAFGEAFLATIGDAMVQMGTSYMMMAIPMLILNDPRGGPLLGAGAGLIAAGTLLSASVGGGSTQGLGSVASSGGGGTTYGGGLGGDSSGSVATAPTEQEIKAPKTVVNLNVQGNILNNKETALYIAEVLEDGFRDQDIQFNG